MQPIRTKAVAAVLRREGWEITEYSTNWIATKQGEPSVSLPANAGGGHTLVGPKYLRKVAPSAGFDPELFVKMCHDEQMRQLIPSLPTPVGMIALTARNSQE